MKHTSSAEVSEEDRAIVNLQNALTVLTRAVRKLGLVVQRILGRLRPPHDRTQYGDAMPAAPNPRDVAREIGAAVSSAATRKRPWPEHLELRDAVDELRRWLADDRQWANTRGGHWRALLQDVNDALTDLGEDAQAAFAAPEFERRLNACRIRFDEKRPPTDRALHRRLERLLDDLLSRLQPDVLVAAWSDLRAAIDAGDDPFGPASHFLSLAAWLGHSSEGVRRMIERELFDGRTPVIDGQPRTDDSHAARPFEERLDAVTKYLAAPAPRGNAVVWLRYQLARVESERTGFPVISLGASVTIYQGEWLRGCVLHAMTDRGLPAEALGPDAWVLRLFLGLPAYGTDAHLEPEDRERPTAYVRVDVGDQMQAQAVEIARSNAEALAAIGALYGAEPTLWSLDESHVVFFDGRDGGSSSAPPSVAEPTFDQRIAINHDRTARELRSMSAKLGPHLPIRDPQLERTTTLLGWLRGARSASPALKLVLCDRVVESVAGWAGVAMPEQFVKGHLIPWWAYARMRGTVIDVAYSLWHPGGLGQATWAPIWEELKQHEPLKIQPYPDATMSLVGLLSETQWLLQRIPVDSRPGELLAELDRLTRTGQSTGAWWDRLRARAETVEKRRFRTRNALMHGGPLAPATVEAVAEFAENLASEALAASIEGSLLGQSLIDYFLDRESRLAEMQARLKAGDPASDVLFSEPDAGP